ncbi:kinase-like domain-containing protein [Flammula alnicola]|nr:kinase-like domain-containing protein [Flammula alnicola]
MTSSTHLPIQSTGLAASAQDSMPHGGKQFIGAVPDEWQLYSDRAEDYTIGAPIGFGASSIVYAATYHPSFTDSSPNKASSKDIPCALKVLDLDSLPPRSLQLLQRETTLMSLSKHPNVLRVRGSWMEGHKLYIALRLMNKGSAADVMRYGWPGGMEEDVVRCILRQALKGLNYLHINGFIHRDVKAANLLIDDDGTVLLGDLGVAADLAEDTSHVHSSSTSTELGSVTAKPPLADSQVVPSISAINNAKRAVAFDDGAPKPRIGKRKSFVGTPCWMSPELIQGKQYDSKADIWSFGITALELTQGRPPRSRESPQRVLLRTIQEDPPTLNRDGGVYKYSRAFKDVVDSCLVKDPAKRPTAEELLQTPFFKAAKKKSYLINTILKDLPPLTQRQERRVIPALLSANSIDSWDFATTLNSPTTSVYRRRVLEEFVSAEDQELRTSGVFEMEEDRRTAATASNDPLTEESDGSVVEEADTEQEALTSSSPTTSQSSILSSEVGPSHVSSPPDTSAPSSYTGSSDLAHRLQAADPTPEPTASRQGKERLGAIPDHNSDQPTVRAGPRATGSPAIPTLWHKLKSNVKRPSPSPASSRNDTLQGDNFEGSPRKDKEKGRVSGMLSSASKGLLSRGSSRSPAMQSQNLN